MYTYRNKLNRLSQSLALTVVLYTVYRILIDTPYVLVTIFWLMDRVTYVIFWSFIDVLMAYEYVHSIPIVGPHIVPLTFLFIPIYLLTPERQIEYKDSVV